MAGLNALASSDLYVADADGGEPTRVTFDGRMISGLAWTPDGRELIFASDRAGDMSLWRVAAHGGTIHRVLGLAGSETTGPALSRHGRRLAFQRKTGMGNIWRLDLSATKRSPEAAAKLVASTAYDSNPQYSPDGKRIVFCSTRSGSYELWSCRQDGSNPVQLTFLGGAMNGFPSWSPDGAQIAFDSNARGNWDVYVIKPEGGAPRPVTSDATAEFRPDWSKDGRWIYFTSNRTGNWQIWRVPAKGGAAQQVTRQGGATPMVSPDGRFVYYAKGLMAPGIWRAPADGGEEIPILTDHDGSKGRWRVAEHGIYFFDEMNQRGIGFFDFRNQQTTDIVSPLEPMPDGALSISPDGHWLLYPQDEHSNSDLMLVKEFR